MSIYIEDKMFPCIINGDQIIAVKISNYTNTFHLPTRGYYNLTLTEAEELIKDLNILVNNYKGNNNGY